MSEGDQVYLEGIEKPFIIVNKNRGALAGREGVCVEYYNLAYMNDDFSNMLIAVETDETGTYEPQDIWGLVSYTGMRGARDFTIKRFNQDKGFALMYICSNEHVVIITGKSRNKSDYDIRDIDSYVGSKESWALIFDGGKSIINLSQANI